MNRSPNTAIDCRTLEEMWSENESNLSNLKAFGCAAYAHQREGKLDARSIKCVFLGYGDGVKGYRLWSLESKGFLRAGMLFSMSICFPKLTNL